MKNMRVAVGLAALLFAFPWLAVTLIANVALAPASLGGSSGAAGVTANNPGTDVILQPSATSGPSSLELVALAAIAASVVTIYAWRLNKNRRKDDYFWCYEQPKGNPLFSLALLGVAVVSFYGLFLLLEHSPAVPVSGQPGSLPPILPYVTLAAVVAGSAVALLVSISMLRSTRVRTQKAAEAVEVDRTELSSVLSKAADALDLGSDYRNAILRCYAAMCQVLDRGGIEDSSKLTAREFESQVATKLNIGRTYLHEATMLFEKARYSTTAVYEEDVKRSQVCLRELSEQVLSSSQQGVRT